jgi:hypothetical protein
MSPRALAAALHRHHNEDEDSWIIEGRIAALLGDEVLYGAALQGGDVFAQAIRDVDDMAAAIDMALSRIQSFAGAGGHH